MLTKNEIQKLQDLPIEQVAEALQIQVARHKAVCPFHNDSHPSLTFNVRKNRYRCYVCGAGGGSIDLVMKSQGWAFYESCCWLAKRFGIILSKDLSYFDARKVKEQKRVVKRVVDDHPYVDIPHLERLVLNPVLNEQARKFLFDERKLSEDVIRKLGISSISQPVPMSGNPNESWFNAPSLLIPYRDAEGRLVSVQARYLGEEKMPRFQFPRGAVCRTFNLQWLSGMRDGDELYFAEGVSDCLALLSSGRNAIAIPSATLLKREDLQPLHLERFRLHMYPDNDLPGEQLFNLLKTIYPTLERHLLPPECKDFGEWWKYKV